MPLRILPRTFHLVVYFAIIHESYDNHVFTYLFDQLWTADLTELQNVTATKEGEGPDCHWSIFILKRNYIYQWLQVSISLLSIHNVIMQNLWGNLNS